MDFYFLLNLLFAYHVLLALPILYLVFLTVFARKSRRLLPRLLSQPTRTFAILIPAHNEERLLPACLASLAHLDYPTHLYTAYVVADNCTDQTAAIAQNMGATVYIRTNPEQRGKPYALEHGLQQIWQSGQDHDAIVILDSDSVVSPNFLSVMAAHLERGDRAIQAFYTASRPEGSWNESLRFTALASVHYLRPLARMILGGSSGLKGNGMVFVPSILKTHHWSVSLTEDIEYHIALLLDGERVFFAPDAIVWGEMPTSLSHAKSQHDRWERGRLQAAWNHAPRLIKASLQELSRGHARRAFLLFDTAAESLIPPFSILAGLNLAGLLAALSAWGVATHYLSQAQGTIGMASVDLFFSAVLMLCQAIYVFRALQLVQAPGAIYKALLYSPILIAWKIAQVLQVLWTRNAPSWVRTARNER